MPDFFDYSHTVAPDEIDAQGHVHNLRYLQWTLWAAGAHSRAGGWDSKQALEQQLGWVVRNHEITYRAAAMEGDAVIIRTWVAEIAKFASLRKYLICRSADETILANNPFGFDPPRDIILFHLGCSRILELECLRLFSKHYNLDTTVPSIRVEISVVYWIPLCKCRIVEIR